jgi:membrane-associated sensor protein
MADESRIFLSTLPADRGERRLAAAAVLVSAAIFAGVAPFAKLPLARLPAFLPVYQSALVVCDLITAILLFGQFGILRSRALLVLAGGYLFSAAMAVFHALSFPGLFSPSGLLGSGPQTTAWLYFLWHFGFPAAVIGYALLDRDRVQSARPRAGAGRAIAGTVAAVLAAAGALMLLATAGHDALPLNPRGGHAAHRGRPPAAHARRSRAGSGRRMAGGEFRAAPRHRMRARA